MILKRNNWKVHISYIPSYLATSAEDHADFDGLRFGQDNHLIVLTGVIGYDDGDQIMLRLG